MAEFEKHFTFFWKIKNASFVMNRKRVISPTFFVQSMVEINYNLYLYSKHYDNNDYVACFINTADLRPNIRCKVDYELSFLSNNGSVLCSEKYFQKDCLPSNSERLELCIKRDLIALLCPDDVLVVRCRMWDRQKQILQSERCFAETKIETECQSFVGKIIKFSSLETGSKNLGYINSPSTKIDIPSIHLCITTNGKLVYEMEIADKSIKRYICKIFIQDACGKKVKFGQGEFRNKNRQCIINLSLSKECLMKNKNLYLPGDVLTLYCEIIFSTQNTLIKGDVPVYEYDVEDTPEMIFDGKKTNLSSNKQQTESLTTLLDDLTSLFNEGILYDTKLKTATDTFPAHTIVLSARSPVFKSMFTTDMKEKTNKCVNIDDLDADTVRRMLSFMYSDTLDDLGYESSKNLYFAADKYNIVSLKRRCSNSLKQNLQQSNCCDVLVLADKHHDKDLKSAVEDYITRNDELVLFSHEWKNLGQEHPHLTIEVLQALYMKNRKS